MMPQRLGAPDATPRSPFWPERVAARVPLYDSARHPHGTAAGARRQEPRMHSIIRSALIALALLTVSVIPAAFGAPPTAAPARDIEPRALELVKAASARLARTKTFTFRTRNAPGVLADSSPFASFFADAQFAVMQPDKVRAKVRGEAPPLDVFFDGKTLTVYQPTLNLYASSDDPGALEALIPFALQRAGVLFPLMDALAGDPQTTLIKRITRARYKGSAAIGGKQCEHGAFAAPEVEWELWIEAKTSLPCRLTGRMLDTQGAPRFAVDFYDWKLNPPLSAASFAFVKPAGAGRFDLRTLMGQ
jgi:hypothetical protein